MGSSAVTLMSAVAAWRRAWRDRNRTTPTAEERGITDRQKREGHTIASTMDDASSGGRREVGGVMKVKRACSLFTATPNRFLDGCRCT
jgi:hypothetical protein